MHFLTVKVKDMQAGRQVGRKAGRWAGRQAGGQEGRQEGRREGRQADITFTVVEVFKFKGRPATTINY